MVKLPELVNYADRILSADDFADYCPNGLQVEGRSAVRKLVSGVTASQALIESAAGAGADLLLVHHGYFWKGEDPRITGMKRKRISSLLEHGISLLAYHLPLDAHPELGNNAQLARVLDFEVQGQFGDGKGPELAFYGSLKESMPASEFADYLSKRLGRKSLHVPGGGDLVHTIGWCTGAAQSYIDAAAERGLDAFVSGEVSEPTVHVARESGIHYFAAGHHATERYGVQALGAHLADHFQLEHVFVDIDNPA